MQFRWHNLRANMDLCPNMAAPCDHEVTSLFLAPLPHPCSIFMFTACHMAVRSPFKELLRKRCLQLAVIKLSHGPREAHVSRAISA